jgi:hypothetical protein
MTKVISRDSPALRVTRRTPLSDAAGMGTSPRVSPFTAGGIRAGRALASGKDGLSTATARAAQCSNNKVAYMFTVKYYYFYDDYKTFL